MIIGVVCNFIEGDLTETQPFFENRLFCNFAQCALSVQISPNSSNIALHYLCIARSTSSAFLPRRLAAAKVHCIGAIKCCVPSVCPSVCPMPTIYSDSEWRRNFKFIGPLTLYRIVMPPGTTLLNFNNGERDDVIKSCDVVLYDSLIWRFVTLFSLLF